MFLSRPQATVCSGFPARARAGHLVAVAEVLTVHMVSLSFLVSSRFLLSSAEAEYSGSAVVLKEEATKAAFSSPTASSEPFRR